VVSVFACIWTLALLYWASIMWSGNQGRYVLPGITAWGVVFAFGFYGWIPPQISTRIRYGISLFIVALMAVITSISYWMYFKPAYAMASAPHEIEHPMSYSYGGYAELIGVSSAFVQADAGDTIEITLYWRALQPAPMDLITYIHSVESDIVRRDSYPATGNLLATEWEPGEEWSEHFYIEIPDDAAPQQTYTLIAGLYDPQNQQTLEATSAGNPVTPVIGKLAIHGQPESIVMTDAYCFGDLFALTAPGIIADDQQITLNLRWQSLHPTAVDYTIFVHVLDDAGETITQVDPQPAYPTRAWIRGEVVEESITLTLPDDTADWHLSLGWYNPQDFTRLPISHCGGDVIGDALTLPE
jgi:hypothetical protein